MSDYKRRNQIRTILMDFKANDKADALREFNKLTIIASDNKLNVSSSLIPKYLSNRNKAEVSEMISMLDDLPILKKQTSNRIVLPFLNNSRSRPELWDKKPIQGNYNDTSLDLDVFMGAGTTNAQANLGVQLLEIVLQPSVKEKLQKKHQALQQKKKRKLHQVKKINISVEGNLRSNLREVDANQIIPKGRFDSFLSDGIQRSLR